MVIIATCHFKDRRDHAYLSVASQDTCRVMAEPGHQRRRDTYIYGGKASTGRNLFHLPSRTCESPQNQRKINFSSLLGKAEQAAGKEGLVILGDFNAWHKSWGYVKETQKGRDLAR
ncbi:hypothetical protein MRX96_036723 [Rhipicephalus microplus]